MSMSFSESLHSSLSLHTKITAERSYQVVLQITHKLTWS